METTSAKRASSSKDDASKQKRSKQDGDSSAKDGKPKKPKKMNEEVALQKSLLSTDKELSAMFLQALREKPESISNNEFARAFWGARTHLLRAHKLELEQRRADYNVLADVKPREVEGTKHLSLLPEQVEDIFRQHPVVRRAYDETVPGRYPDNSSFWIAFFNSRLFKKLKGERITDGDSKDVVLDKYLDASTAAQQTPSTSSEQHIPHFIDLEGNEQNHSQRKGNQPDPTMRPSDKVPILRILNSMSEKIMAHVAPTDGDPHAPIGIDEDTYNQLRLRDLAADDPDAAVVLNIRDRQLLGPADTHPSPSTSHTPRNPSATLAFLRSSLAKTLTTPLSTAIDFTNTPDDEDDDDDEADSDSDTAHPAAPTTHSRLAAAAQRKATAHIQSLIRQQTDSLSVFAGGAPSTRPDTAVTAALLRLQEPFLRELIMTHHTTNEFLHYFWHVLLKSAGGALSSELPALLKSLDNSLSRIASEAQAAEAVRLGKLQELRKEAKEREQRLRRRVVVDEAEAGAGKKEVEWLMEPMVRAIGVARDKFQVALKATGANVAA